MSEAKKKTIVINASTVMFGGGLIVTIDVIQLLHQYSGYHLHLLCPNIKRFQKLSSEVKKNYTPRLFFTFYFRFILDFFWIPNKIKSINPDLVITLGNLPARTSYRQLMLNDNAFVSQKIISELPLSIKNYIKHYIRKKLFWQRLTFVNLLIVQTNTEKNRLLDFKKPTPEIVVLPPLLPHHLSNYSTHEVSLPMKDKGTIRLVCASHYWEHKNLEVLPKVLSLAVEQDVPLQIVFSFKANKKRRGKVLSRELQPYIESGHVINLGGISPAKIVSAIKQSDGVILPSLLESYGLNYLEAWFSKKVLFISDKPFAKEVCDDAAVYIDPINAEGILKTITSSFLNKTKLSEIIKSGSRKLDNWSDPLKLLVEIEKCIGK